MKKSPVVLEGEVPFTGPQGVLSASLGRSVVHTLLKTQRHLLEISPDVSLGFSLRLGENKLLFAVNQLRPCEQADQQAYVADRILEKYEAVYILARVEPRYVPRDLGTGAYLLGEFLHGVVLEEEIRFDFHQLLFSVQGDEVGRLRDDVVEALPTIRACGKVPGDA